MDLGIARRTALVLGGGGGLGRAIAHSLAREGASVAVGDIHGANAEETAGQIREAGGNAIGLEWDLGDLDRIEPCFAEIEWQLGPVDILINNTGGPPPTPAAGQDAQIWSRYFGSMVLSVIAITDRAVPGMRDRKWGRIVTSTSSGVLAPIPNLGISNTLRSALVGWSKTIASELACDNVTANIVVPGRIATQRTLFLDEKYAERAGRSRDDVEAEFVDAIPMRRYGDPGEYADVVAFLASERASYLTGSIIRVDGGAIPAI